MPGTLPPKRLPRDPAPPAPQARPAAGYGRRDMPSSSILGDLGPPSPDSEERAASLVGTLISGRYLVQEILGQGGMGAVYRGEQTHLRKRVAIKVLHPNPDRIAELAIRFEREAVAGAHIQHPNVAAAIDFGKLDDGSCFLVLEYVEGETLADVLRAGPLPAIRALRIARQMAAGLEAVHEKGVVHRDIKPHNTLLGPGDAVKIIDFGLAKVRVDLLSEARRREPQPEKALTAAGVVFGTPAYLSPEASFGMAAVDARSDLYALGVVLYEMLCGRQPFEWSTPASLFRHQRLEDPPRVRARVPGILVPAEAEEIVMRLVQRSPGDRYQTAHEVVAAIDEALPRVESGDHRRAKPAFFQVIEALRLPRWALVPTAVGSLAVGCLLVLGVFRLAGHHADNRLKRGADRAIVYPSISGGLPVASGDAQVPAPVATAASSSPIREVVTEIDGLDAAGWRLRLEQATSIRDWVLGSKAFLALAALDPALLDDAATRSRVIAVTAGIAHDGSGDQSEGVFSELANGLGTSGLDLLYEIALSRGGTRAGQRARAILAEPHARERQSPELRIAFEFFVTPCSARRSLLGRAAAEGDRRTLVQLEVAHGARCSNRKDPCCFREDPRMVEAIARLRARVEH